MLESAKHEPVGPLGSQSIAEEIQGLVGDNSHGDNKGTVARNRAN